MLELRMSSSKTLIILRHAHRDLDERTRDNGLSDKGREQVKRMLSFAKRRLDESSPVFLTSPKKRCVETISPVAKELGHEVRVDERLVEHLSGESDKAYLARIDEFLDFFKYECPEVTVICSHGDWIPVAIERLTGAQSSLRKCGWAEIEYVAGSSYLKWLVQKHY